MLIYSTKEKEKQVCYTLCCLECNILYGQCEMRTPILRVQLPVT